ncbi:MAG TPA: bifunctional phosphoglucose/phosphomannose isomerase [Bellilinea sp.]|nr:bifunctional phosphoglucose/phosphomannose isomerase [Bellilinea sp.]
MNLDDIHLYNDVDQSDMLSELLGLPDQLQRGYSAAKSFPLTAESPQHVVICGMGGSAIGGDLVAAYVEPFCKVPITVNRDYDLPAWVNGRQYLVVGSSHSGNTEETISAYKQAVARGCQTVAISTGGAIASIAKDFDRAAWRFDHTGQPRAAVGYSFALLLALLEKAGLIPDQTGEVEQAVKSMADFLETIRPNVEIVKNPAKRQAGQLIDRLPIFFGSGLMVPVTKRWKGQVGELAKSAASAETLPEACHNTLSGIDHPDTILQRTTAIFIRSSFDHPRNQLRSKLTHQAYLKAGIGIDTFNVPGKTRLSQLWNAILFGDFLAYYLAIAYGVDPTPIPNIAELKKAMS